MTKRAVFLSATLLAGLFQMGALGAALAQSNDAAGANQAAGGGANQAAGGGAGGGGGGGGEQGGETATQQSPVAYITSIEVVHLSRAPAVDMVRVMGMVPTINWGAGTLVPLVRGVPSDGVLDLELVSTGPQGTQLPSAFYPVDAWLPLQQGHPYKAIRVRGAFNALTLHEMPGFTEAKLPVGDLTKIIGMKLIAKGGSGEGIKVEDLPPGTKIIGPNDGINDQTRDPNRLTIYVGEDGKVLDAYYN